MYVQKTASGTCLAFYKTPCVCTDYQSCSAVRILR